MISRIEVGAAWALGRKGARIALAVVGVGVACLACGVSAAALAAAPSAKTVSVHVLDGERATVIGTVERGGVVTNVSADDGLIDGKWCASDGREGTPTETSLAGLEEEEGVPSEARVALKGLEPETSYCAELVAHNEDGTGYGGQIDFKTLEKGALSTEPEQLLVPPKYVKPYVREEDPVEWGAISGQLRVDEAREREAREASEREREALAVRCVVPHLRGRSLTGARSVLASAHCVLGKVRDFSTHRGVVVVVQSVPAGRTMPADTAVGVRLGRLVK
jgi:hypothetical protein